MAGSGNSLSLGTTSYAGKGLNASIFAGGLSSHNAIVPIMAQSVNRDSLAAQFFITDSAVNNVVIATVILAVSSLFVFNNDLTLGVAVNNTNMGQNPSKLIATIFNAMGVLLKAALQIAVIIMVRMPALVGFAGTANIILAHQAVLTGSLFKFIHNVIEPMNTDNTQTFQPGARPTHMSNRKAQEVIAITILPTTIVRVAFRSMCSMSAQRLIAFAILGVRMCLLPANNLTIFIF